MPHPACFNSDLFSREETGTGSLHMNLAWSLHMKTDVCAGLFSFVGLFWFVYFCHTSLEADQLLAWAYVRSYLKERLGVFGEEKGRPKSQ